MMRLRTTLALVAVVLAACGLWVGGAPTVEAKAPAETVARLELAQAALAADPSASTAETLAKLAARIRPLSRSASIRHRIADATFCFPQNVLGILFYAFLELTGGVVATAEAGGARLIATHLPLAVSLGKYVIVNEEYVTDRVVAHELGHTIQSYRRGPFYLAIEGAASFAQAALALVSPTFALGYLSRWPENEADALGMAAFLPPSP